MPRTLVATDLDGTLLSPTRTVTPATRAALAALGDAGVPVVFVTARPLRWMTDLWSLVGSHGLAIVSNGAVLYDVTAQQVVDVAPVDRTVGLEILRHLAAAIPGVGLGIERVPSGLAQNGTYVPDEGSLDDVAEVGVLAEHWDEPVVKLLARSTTLASDELRRTVASVVGDRALCTWSVPGLVEISAAGVTKAWRLETVCASLGVARGDVWAFGDMPNDIPMLDWAGHPYVMANGDPDLVAAARAGRYGLAPSNAEDGVAAVVGQLL